MATELQRTKIKNALKGQATTNNQNCPVCNEITEMRIVISDSTATCKKCGTVMEIYDESWDQLVKQMIAFGIKI